MKIIIYTAFLCFFSLGCSSAVQQQYTRHTVQKGETVSSISRDYGVSKEVLYRLNPDAKRGLNENSVLILPDKDIINSSSDVDFKIHRVSKKETLFSISQLYNVSIDEIKKYNKDLYSRGPNKGEKLRIPLAARNNPRTAETTPDANDDLARHKVKAKETKFGIARKYGISIAQLEKLNPGLEENLPVGTVLNVPEESVIGSATIEEDTYGFYEVQPKEGFFRLKVKLGLSEEEIVALNPYAKEGLKEGMILKVPKNVSEVAVQGSAKAIDLERKIVNRSKKNIAVMLPFKLTNADNDSTDANVKLLKESGTLRVALDFYSGVLMAAEFAKDKGISTVIDVYDTEGSSSKINSIIAQNNFKNVDAVIGPLLSSNVENAAAQLKKTDTPVFSPLSNKEIKMYSNFFQTLPTDEMLKETLLSYLNKNESGKNFIVIADAKSAADKNAVLSALSNAKVVTPRSGGYVTSGDISSNIESGRDNWVILSSANPVLVSNVVGLLNGMPSSYNLRLFTLDKNDAYEYNDVSNIHLAKLNFTFPSVNRSYNYNDTNAFLTSYKNKYGVLPNRYAVRGFDIMYDVLLRLASADDVYDATESDYVTEYIENKFRYSKKLFSGYQNNAAYVIKYTKDLQFEVVE